MDDRKTEGCFIMTSYSLWSKRSDWIWLKGTPNCLTCSNLREFELYFDIIIRKIGLVIILLSFSIFICAGFRRHTRIWLLILFDFDMNYSANIPPFILRQKKINHFPNFWKYSIKLRIWFFIIHILIYVRTFLEDFC